MTPIAPDLLGGLRDYLEGLSERGHSPLAKVSRTHMARWVIVEGFNCDARYAPRRPETIANPSLVFSSNFDGDLDSYLDGLCESLAAEAPLIWGRCVGCPTPARGAALKGYLKHNEIDCGLSYAAYGQATVDEVRAGLAQRDRLISFATRAQGMAPAELQRAFVEEFGA